MKKILLIIGGTIVVFISGFIIGRRTFMKGNIASVIIRNQSAHTIMTATINHETGSVIAANIKKGRSEHVRFLTGSPNSYSITATFDDNRTIYSDSARAIENGNIIVETIRDSVIVPSSGN